MPEDLLEWQQVCVALNLNKAALETWLRPLVPVSLEGGLLTLAAESQFAADTVARRYAPAIATAAAQVLGHPVRVRIITRTGLNNLNNNISRDLDQGDPGHHAPEEHGSLPKGSNLNNLKREPAKKRGGVPRIQLFTDPTLQKALAWGVEEWLIQVSIREYGEYTVKGQINRLHQIPDSYFKPQYGPIPQQRGRLFNKEMQKLKDRRQIG